MSPNRFKQAIFRMLASVVMATSSFSAGAALDIPDYPLFLTSTGVPPNIVMTFDDSGSMRRGWAPEAVASDQAVIDGPRFKAASVNGLYYSPFITYPIPTRSDSTTYSTSFTSAKFNGFDSGSGTINLSTSYKVIGQSEPDHAYSDCPCYNTTSCSTFLTTTNSSGTCRLVKHPGSITTTTNTQSCNVTFTDRGTRRGRPRNDEISIQNTSGACSTFFSNARADTIVTVTNAGSYNGSYRIVSVENDRTVRIPNAWTSSSTDSTTTLSYSYTTTTGGNTAAGQAYYYLFWRDKPGATQPGSCNDSRANDNCYIRVDVSATSGQDRDGNGTISAAEQDERQNFANWYSFYRTRSLAVMSGAMTAVTGLSNGAARLGWQTINDCTSFGTSCSGYDGTNRENRLRTLSSAYKTNFYNWLQRMVVSGNTPLRSAMVSAGNYFTTSGTNSPYADDPYVTRGTEHSCRKNFHVMFTDGLWNSDSGFSTPGGSSNPDSSGTTSLPDGNTYTPRAPYQDVNVATSTTYTNTNSISDTAFYYWATDLRNGGSGDNSATCTGSTCNNLAPYTSDRSGTTSDQYWNPKNDPATWQHMVNYTIGLGLSASLKSDCYYRTGTGTNLVADPNNPNPGCPEWGGGTYDGDYADLFGGALNWPRINTSPTINEEPDGHVYELWHAAINSRGKFYSADDPAELTAAFVDVMNTITSIAKAGGGAGLSSNTTAFEVQTTIVYEAKFNQDWSGALLARPIDANGNLGTPYWDAATRVPVSRNIYTMNGSSAELFNSCTGSLATALGANCAAKLNWLRGGAAQETRNGGTLRDRVWTITAAALANYPADYQTRCALRLDGSYDCPWVLGDIMNSDPIYTQKEDYGYATTTLTGSTSYRAYVDNTKTNRSPVIYVGANDGMLHAVQAEKTGTNAGVELFAYVPAGVYHNLNVLTDPTYTHKYFVDGSPAVGDAYIGGAWGTYLAGSLGAGGKTVFALDITRPTAFAASDVLWEYNKEGTDNDMGLTYGQPQIAALQNGKWGVIFSNGYNSTNGCAALYIIPLDWDGTTAADVKKINTGACGDNGLSTPYLRLNSNKVVEAVYAGDLKGNLWKFDLSSATPASWQVANSGTALFVARNTSGEVQSITSQPKIATHPNGGKLVYFGTGRYLVTDDVQENLITGVDRFDDVQSFYAIWDVDCTSGCTSVPRAALLQQEIEETTDAFDPTLTVRITSNYSPDWTDPAPKNLGWYMDLPSTAGKPSERVISTPIVMEFTDTSIPDRVLFVTNTPADDPCSSGGTTWLMELDLITGSRTSRSVFDFSGPSGTSDGAFDDYDKVTRGDGTTATASGIALPSTYGITGEPLLLTDPTTGKIVKEFSGSTGVSGTAGGPGQLGEVPGGSVLAPTRIYWQQIL